MTVQQHDRTLYHTGTEDATTAILASPIGRYDTGATVQYVLEDLDRRLSFIEQNGCTGLILRTFTMNAYFLPDAHLTLDAYIHVGGVGTLRADAIVKAAVPWTLTANAYLLEVVC